MKLSFHIEYRTGWGEELRLCGNVPELGNGQPGQSIALHTADGIHWTAETEVDTKDVERITYKYMVYANGRMVRAEWDALPRTLSLAGVSASSCLLADSWRDRPEQDYLYTSAFTECVMAHTRRQPAPVGGRGQVLIKAYAPYADHHHTLCLCGSGHVLGNWDPARAFRMSDADFPTWQAVVDAGEVSFPLEFKFVLRDDRRGGAVVWEDGFNRCLPCPPTEDGQLLVVNDLFPAFPLPQWKGAGVAIPVFSLRTEGSFGIGDFGDLKRFVSWAAKTGQSVVQILPINDTTMSHTRRDSYPYNSMSIYALHPMYIDLRQLGALSDTVAAQRLEAERLRLNALPAVDYEGVDAAKWEYLRLVYADEGERTFRTPTFRRFYATNREWLLPYAVYSYLRDTYGTADFRRWPTLSNYDEAYVERLYADQRRAIGLYLYVQYQLHRQLSAASRQARTHGIVLKGDIPIGISRNSVEAWKEPHYFNLNGQAGAPPDDFAVDGQNWGFPTYRWDVMQADGYAWWVKRFRKMAEYFDAYRIDHILGFFRIWEIPTHSVHGLLGQFVPSLPMSREEIEGYGLAFDAPRFLSPYIDDGTLASVFGDLAGQVKAVCLEVLPDQPGHYRLLPAYDTQRKVEAMHGQWMANGEPWSGEQADRVRDGLYALVSNVLFIRDAQDADRYHPRITAQLSHTYRALSNAQRQAFDRLYEDYYFKRHDAYWRECALEKLPRLTGSTRMLVCGEDLGMIPSCVPGVMNLLHILSLEIERMPKAYGVEFGRPADYPYLSVCTISTHDMSTLRGWWQEDTAQAQRYYHQELGLSGKTPDTATPELCRLVLRRHLGGRSMLCILSWQDWLSIDPTLRRPDVEAERINVPANPRQYWRYRMHLSIEQLEQADELNRNIRALISESGRSI